MSTDSPRRLAERLLDEARSGSAQSLGRLLQLYANYLRLLTTAQLEQRLRGRVSPSDVVQETFFEAHRDFTQFRGTTTAQFTAWLRRILVNNLYRVVEQHILAEKRDVRRELSLEGIATALEQSTARLEAVLPDPGRSPCGDLQHQELEVILADEIASLPADYREVIVLRHIQMLPFEEIGKRMDRSAGAARMLWLRAIRQLRDRLESMGMG
jgi:RNA polymerase sigma-70 factor (ECF subfamily)